MIFIVEAFDRSVFDGPVRPFDLSIRPRMFWLCGSVVDVGLGASIFEGMRPEILAFGQRLLDEWNG